LLSTLDDGRSEYDVHDAIDQAEATHAARAVDERLKKTAAPL
jgi:hypothetical protein